MGAEPAMYWPHESVRNRCRAETYALNSGAIYSPPHRMEAGFYASEGYRSVQAMRQSGFQIKTINDFADVKWYGVQTRVFVKDPELGIPYLNTSGMMEIRPTPNLYLSKSRTKNVDFFIVKKDMILISMSGSVGNIRIVDERMDNWAVTVDALRVRAKFTDQIGTLYCLFQSPPGQFLLKRSQSGSVVSHIYEQDVGPLPIPKLPLRLREELTRLVKKTSDLRVEANRLLDDAEQEVQAQLNLPDIEGFKSSYDEKAETDAEIFSVNFGNRIGSVENFGELRVDTNFHEPISSALQDYLLRQKEGAKLGLLLEDVFDSNLRKRVYVEEDENGVPLLGGKSLCQMQQNNLSYISIAKTKNIDNERVKRGWVLVSSGGTVGRTLFVYKNFEGWIMTQDVMRLIPNNRKIYSGFLYAFLSSPYGQIQLEKLSYGSVQKRLRAFQFESIAIKLPKDNGKQIHNIVVSAFNKRAEAKELENRSHNLFMKAINDGREVIEKTWGEEY